MQTVELLRCQWPKTKTHSPEENPRSKMGPQINSQWGTFVPVRRVLFCRMHQSPKVLATTMDLYTQNFHFYVKKPFVKSARTLFEPKQAKKWHLVRSSRGGGAPRSRLNPPLLPCTSVTTNN